MKTFPKLFKKTSTGADQGWEIRVEGNTIISQWGQVGGAQQTARDVIASGKNAGRANATTPEQQAELEAQSQWEKKLKRGYVQDLKAARAGKVDDVIEGGIFPMLAHKYRDHAEKIIFPAYAQPKLDGHRCVSVGRGLWSRTRKPIVSVPHIVEAVKALGLDDTTLDGELYNHEYRHRFEELSSFIRPEYAKPGHEVVQYHVYDCTEHGGFSGRIAYLKAALGGVENPVVLVETIQVLNEDELMVAFEKFRAQGYEGAMVRNAGGPYVNKRSYDLQKIKEFDDAEFEVIDVSEGRGKLAGHGIFVCKTADGAVFEAKMKGALEKLKAYYKDPKLAVGRMLTVQYQGMTTKSGVPRFPVALRFRTEAA